MAINPYAFDPDFIHQFIKEALYEDVRDGDVTANACIPTANRNRAILKVKSEGILAGVKFAEMVFKYVDKDAEIKVLMHDGDVMHFGDIAFEVTCNSRALLTAERLVLNTMQRMSGIATLSRRFADEVKDFPVKVLDTRKTTPLFRYFEKWAVKIGGCDNYRFGLFDRYMIKDNHVDAAGGILNAINAVVKDQKDNKTNLPLTVEVRNIEELQLALSTQKADQIMLDNFDIVTLKKAVKLVNGTVPLEASGGVNIKTIKKIVATGVNFISVGALTHSSISLDLSLKIVK
jgi:nicotinate-nucleotide pyrophosphorylase (carboxylating)